MLTDERLDKLFLSVALTHKRRNRLARFVLKSGVLCLCGGASRVLALGAGKNGLDIALLRINIQAGLAKVMAKLVVDGVNSRDGIRRVIIQ